MCKGRKARKALAFMTLSLRLLAIKRPPGGPKAEGDGLGTC